MRKTHALIAAATLAALTPAAHGATAPAGTAGSGTGNEAVDLSLGETQRNREERGFPWGLLGLLGLAGLLGRKRRDDHRTGTGTGGTRT